MCQQRLTVVREGDAHGPWLLSGFGSEPTCLLQSREQFITDLNYNRQSAQNKKRLKWLNINASPCITIT